MIRKIKRLHLSEHIICIAILLGLALAITLKLTVFSKLNDIRSISELFLVEPCANKDNFESTLDNWQISGYTGGSISIVPVASGIPVSQSTEKNVLKLGYSNPAGFLQINKEVCSSQKSNSVFSIDFYDPGVTLRGGVQFRVENEVSEYFIGINATKVDNNYYALRPGKSDKPFFNTGIKRTVGWHKFEIHVTEAGTYSSIDGKNLSYLPSINNVSPVNTSIKSVTKVGIATTWQQTGDYYFDNFEVKPFLPYENAEVMLKKQIAAYLQAHPFTSVFTPSVIETKQDTVAPFTTLYYFRPEPNWQNTIAEPTRTMANYLLANSFSCRYIENMDQGCINRSVQMIHSLLKKENYNNWKGQRTHDEGFYFPNSFLYPSSPLTFYPILLSSWMLWDKLPSGPSSPIRELVTSRTTAEANFWAQHKNTPDTARRIKRSVPGDSNSEEYAWTSAFLMLAGNMFNNPNWSNAGILMANEAISQENSGATISVTDRSRIWNHNMIHPGYALYSMASLSEGLLGYKLYGRSYSNVLNRSTISSFVEHNLFTTIDNSSFRYTDPSTFICRTPNNLGQVNKPNCYDGKDDWARGPDTAAGSAYMLLSKLGVSNYESRLTSLLQFRYYTQNENFIPYNVRGGDVTIVHNQGYEPNSKYREVIESILPLYDVVTYLWIRQ